MTDLSDGSGADGFAADAAGLVAKELFAVGLLDLSRDAVGHGEGGGEGGDGVE